MISQVLDSSLEIGEGAGLADLVEIGFAEVLIGHALGKHVVGGDEDLVGDGEGGSQRAATGFEAVELVPEIAALGSATRRSPRRPRLS